MNKKRPRADLFKLTAVMNDKGNVEMDMDCVNPEQFIRAMEATFDPIKNPSNMAGAFLGGSLVATPFSF